jgi:chaperonin cofactor prefoldin
MEVNDLRGMVDKLAVSQKDFHKEVEVEHGEMEDYIEYLEGRCELLEQENKSMDQQIEILKEDLTQA